MGQIEGISVETLMLAKKYTDEHGGGGGGATDAGSVSYDETKTYKEGTVGAELTAQKNAIGQLQPAATSSDIGKALIVKTVDTQTGKPSSYEYGGAGGGGGQTDIGLSVVNGQICVSYSV